MWYLINGQSVRVPGLDAGLIDIHDGHCDLRTHVSDHATRRASYIPSTNATDSLYLKHLHHMLKRKSTEKMFERINWMCDQDTY